MGLTIDILRHGEAEGGSCYRGRQDDPLSSLGFKQMQAVVPAIVPWDRVISSPLQRCQAFAQELAQTKGLPITLDAAWQEIYFGDWEGLTADDIRAQDPLALQRYYDDPVLNTPPGAESLLSFQSRISQAWQALIGSATDEHLLLVCHGGVVRILLQQVMQFPQSALFRLQVPHACLSRILVDEYDGELHPSLVFHGGTLR